MDYDTDKFFGTCHGLKFKLGRIPQSLTVDFRAYKSYDNINIKNYTVSFYSPAWVTEHLKYHQSGIGMLLKFNLHYLTIIEALKPHALQSSIILLGWTFEEEDKERYKTAGISKVTSAPLQNPGTVLIL